MNEFIESVLENMKKGNPEIALATKLVETASGNNPETIIMSLTLVMGFVVAHFAKDPNARMELHKLISEILEEEIKETMSYTKERASAILSSIENAPATKQ